MGILFTDSRENHLQRHLLGGKCSNATFKTSKNLFYPEWCVVEIYYSFGNSRYYVKKIVIVILCKEDRHKCHA